MRSASAKEASEMSELRVPTVALDAEVLCTDGRRFRGRIFVPTTASRHTGPTRPEEWMNDAAPFFPFLPDEAEVPMILNKREVIAIAVPAEADAAEIPDSVVALRRVTVDTADRSFTGTVAIDMPEGRTRLLDVLNRPEFFLTLRDGERHQLIQKRRIVRVLELREG
jgi:hypothetical protein